MEVGFAAPAPGARTHEALTAGLSRAVALPPGQAWLQLDAGWESWSGAYGSVEVGKSLGAGWGAFGFGRVDTQGQSAGIGVRKEW